MSSESTSSSDSQVKVAVVDDHVMVAEGLASILALEVDFLVVGTASTIEAGIELIASTHPDVVIADYQFPDGDGAFLTTEILRQWPDIKVIMYSALGNDELLARAVESGCSGFIAKDRPSGEIISAVRAASRGESLIQTSALVELLERLRHPLKDASGTLSPRELEVLQLVAEGKSTSEIRDQLYVSEHTVRNHIRNVLTKLGAHSKGEAVAIAARTGIITLGRAS